MNDLSRPMTALPSVRARVLAFVSIIAGGALSGLIGWLFAGLQTSDSGSPSDLARGVTALIFATIGGIGIACVAVLALRAMNEWKRVETERQQRNRLSS